MPPLRIATRSSELALRQAALVEAALSGLGLETELVTYTTVGDRILDQPLSEIGAKGLFTQELEDDLLNGRVDCCVHSLKDLPTEVPHGLEIVAVLPREDPRDVLVLGGPHRGEHIGTDVLDLLPPGSRVGTSSLRRRAQLLARRPDLQPVELRGNVPTRLRKVREGVVDAGILAAAGVHRLGALEQVAAYLDAPDWLPAAGQGAIAIQIRASDAAAREQFAKLDDPGTMLAVRAERAFLAALEGGCQVPIGALASEEGGGMALRGMILSLDGMHLVRGERLLGDDTPERAGELLAEELLDRGGREILEGVRGSVKVPAPQPE